MNQHVVPAAEECPWETGALGASEEHARPKSAEHDRAVDESLELQLISIRLPKALIADLKFIAGREGLGYQPMIRRILNRFAEAEFRSMAREELIDSCKTPETAAQPEEIVEEPVRKRA